MLCCSAHAQPHTTVHRFRPKKGYEEFDYNPEEEGSGSYYYQALGAAAKGEAPRTALSEETMKRFTTEENDYDQRPPEVDRISQPLTYPKP